MSYSSPCFEERRKKGKRVVVAMSGGVDSSVAAYLLKKEGFDVVGVTLKLFPEVSRCCRLEDIEDARKVAHFLDIPHYTFDFTQDFKKIVVDYFTFEYMAGRTPNPCVICNQKIKFGLLLQRAQKMGASFLATGHYARVKEVNGGLYLVKARDKGKSQEYFLAFLSEEVLRQVLFPLGEYSKKDIKKISEEARVPLKPKRESQEVCFVPSENYVSFIEDHLGVTIRNGTTVSSAGEPLGTHKGFLYYTIGQRRGIGIRAFSPYYVIGIDPIKNEVIIGSREEAYCNTMKVHLVLWRKGEGIFPLSVRIRYRHDPAPATVEIKGMEALVKFNKPQFAPAPGQIAVFYEQNRIIGSGKIGVLGNRSSTIAP